MPTNVDDEIREEARQSLARMQEFDTNTLPQADRLGKDLNFADSVVPADRLIHLYKLISLPVLDELPRNALERLKNRANEDFTRLNNILSFDSNQNSPRSARDNLINELTAAYQPAFDVLHPMISFSTSRATDFKGLESQARATAQSIQDKANGLMRELEAAKTNGEKVLADIRRVAAEEGVSQQAIHFSNEAKDHNSQANLWLKCTLGTGGALLMWAIGSIFLHKWEFLKPTTTYESVQFALSKVLIFGVFSFAVYLSAKNFLSHKHNAIVNKHRQNALATYTALVDAASTKTNADIVLAQASACIFSPQPTGYTSGKPIDGAMAKSVVELFGKPMAASE